MVRSYHDPMKQKARANLVYFVRKYLSHISPKDMRVLCFPGAEIDGQEALEVKEVYDVLGVPRQNIIGVERDAQNAQRLRKADLGIHVIEADLVDYLKQPNVPVFDIVSLDYMGQRGDVESLIMDSISGDQHLAPRSIVHTNYLGRRESQLKQERMVSDLHYGNLQERVATLFLRNIERGTLEKPDNIKDVLAQAHKDIDIRVKTDLSRLEQNDIPLDKLRENYAFFDSISLRQSGYITDPASSLIFDFNGIRDRIKRDARNSTYHLRGQMLENIYEVGLTMKQIVAKKLEPRFGVCAAPIVDYSVNAPLNVRSLRAMERYEYVSNKNATMLTTFFCVENVTPRIIEAAQNILGLRDVQLRINPNCLRPAKFDDEVERVSEYVNNRVQLPPKPIFLGSSYSPPPRKELISRVDAVGLLRGGASCSEIAECYRGFDVGQLAALKAHYVTMNKLLPEERT